MRSTAVLGIAATTVLLMAALPPADSVKPVKILDVDRYCEGVVFDHDGNGYISHNKSITQFFPDGKSKVWATSASPNGHKVLGDGTHLVCDAGEHAILHFDANGKRLPPASTTCDGQPLSGPNDLTLDPSGGFYFTDPGVGKIHYVDPEGVTHLVTERMRFPNGIVFDAAGKRLLVAESRSNRILEFPLMAPGKTGPMRTFAELPEGGQPDGICLDADRNLYAAHHGGKEIVVLDPQGKLLARYPAGNVKASNVAFGGPNRDQLFTTGSAAGDSPPGTLYRLDLGVKGLDILPPRQAN